AADEDFGAGAAIHPTHTGLRNRALPPDGRGYLVPARIRVYARNCVRPGGILRHDHFARQPGAEELPGSGEYRPDHGHAGCRVSVSTDPQLDSGAAGPVLLPRSV